MRSLAADTACLACNSCSVFGHAVGRAHVAAAAVPRTCEAQRWGRNRPACDAAKLEQ